MGGNIQITQKTLKTLDFDTHFQDCNNYGPQFLEILPPFSAL